MNRNDDASSLPDRASALIAPGAADPATDAAQRFQLVAPASADALLERESAFAQLLAAARDAADGHGLTCLLTGEAGIGKTTLLDAWSRQMLPACRVLLGRCDALFTPQPLGPLRDIAFSLDGRLAAMMDGGANQGVVFTAFLHELASNAEPTLVILEDVHWADHATFDLIKYVGRRIGRLPVLLVLSFREDELDRAHPLRGVIADLPSAELRRIALTGLSAAAVASLAQQAGMAADGLFAATGGNPFFVTETLASRLARVPETVRDAVLGRVARLSDDARALLDLASVVPGRIDLAIVRAAAPEISPQALEECLARGVLLATDGGVTFRHELARRAIEDTLPPSERRHCHARMLALLAQHPGTPASQLVHHAAAADDAQRVPFLALAAANAAARLGAHHEAATYHATGLRFAAAATPEQRADLYEGWSYESSICGRIDNDVIDARHRAIELRRQLGDAEGEGRNLRWLSRLHWYQGNRAEAQRYIDEAVTILETIPAGAELAMAYSVRSQLFMLNDRTTMAVEWGERAYALAEQLDEVEIRIHALNNVGSALLFSGDEQGRAKLEDSLRLALGGGFHEHAARCYTNLSEHAVSFKNFTAAERYLTAGIAFDIAHDLDSWTPYLLGWQAQMRFDQGRHAEAQEICERVLATPGLTTVMRLPALTVLGRLRTRLGQPGALLLLEEAMALAHQTGESQRIVLAALGLIEGAWLADDAAAGCATLERVEPLAILTANAWLIGELGFWRACLSPEPASTSAPDPAAAPPYQHLSAGRVEQAAADFAQRGCRFQQALALLTGGTAEHVGAALQILDAIGAAPAAERARGMARGLGLRSIPGARRGPYLQAGAHPFGLTRRESDVLALLADGLSNAEIADRLKRSAHTIEHHVSAVLAKMQVKSRMEAVALARRQNLFPPAGAADTP